LATRASSYSAMLDACVLYPAPLRDLLVQIAMTGLFRARWTNEICEEWIGAILRDRPDLSRDQLERTRTLMNTAVRDRLVSGYEPLIGSVVLPDENDRHVVADAIHARCDAVVTFNLKDFPGEAVEAHNIEVIHPDDFLFHQIGRNQARIISSVNAVRRRLVNPAVSADDYLATLRSQSLPKTVAALEPLVTVI
jgi:hypothetical protein